jgi:hypothetical protein
MADKADKLTLPLPPPTPPPATKQHFFFNFHLLGEDSLHVQVKDIVKW